MKKILNFLQQHRHIIVWTICYFIVSWAIMLFMFKFNIFNGNHWHRLAYTHLHGFPGFVFGILILAMFPLYIASSTLIIRKKQPLITIPLPKVKLPGIAQKPATPTPSETPNTDNTKKDETPKLSSDIPDEMHSAFLRAHRNLERFAAYNRANTQLAEAKEATSQPDTPAPINSESAPELDLPIPTDFDISFDDTADTFADIPTWTDIDFNTPAEPVHRPAPNEKLAQHLTDTGTEFTTDGEVFVTPTHAIITHSDPDFWVTDDDNWFATGKSRPSPIKTVVSAAKNHNLTPAIYLSETNILDIETLIPQWESDGIIVITDLNKF